MIQNETTKLVPKTRVGKPKMNNQELPLEVIEKLQSIDKRTPVGKETRKAYMKKLHSLNWTLTAIARGAGLSRERVRQLIEENKSYDFSLVEDFPAPRVDVWVASAKKEIVLPDEEILKRLLELKAYAARVRSHSPRYREEAEEYTKLINECVENGVTLYRLSKLLDVTHGALLFRLVRYGYKETTGTSKSLTKVLDKNRKQV
jgi:hypothetical protein